MVNRYKSYKEIKYNEVEKKIYQVNHLMRERKGSEERISGKEMK